MFRRLLNAAVRRGVETTIQATAETAADVTTRAYFQIFEVSLPTTVYIRASMSQITLRYQPGNRVEVSANLRASFGWDLLTEQDEAGVYIVARRKLVIGSLSSADFTLTVPPGVNLVFNLTPGAVKFVNINGKFSIAESSFVRQPTEALTSPGGTPEIPAKLDQGSL